MPWQESPLKQRVELMQGIAAGATAGELAEKYGVSRKTVSKWKARYKAEGIEGLKARSRAPKRSPTKTSQAIVERLLRLKRKHPGWGPEKFYKSVGVSISTAHRILKAAGQVKPKPRRKAKQTLYVGGLSEAKEPNDVWSIDFKGQFRMKDGRQCYPLTVTDNASRFILGIVAMKGTEAEPVKEAMKRLFRRYGLPKAIRSDNGNPFDVVGPRPSQLSRWWESLGIKHERIEPGKPQQNGRHERMHRTMLVEMTDGPAEDMQRQQAWFDSFRRCFNAVRPHEALNGLTPGSKYVPSEKRPEREKRFKVPAGWAKRIVGSSGRALYRGKRPFISKTLAGKYIHFDYQTPPNAWLQDEWLGTLSADGRLLDVSPMS